MKNRWKIMAKANKKKGSGRRKFDDYETPAEVVFVLGQFLKLRKGSVVLEPCCGSRRMVRAIRKTWPHTKVFSSDVKQGIDFLKRTKTHKGSLITNPPYRDGMARAMVDQALRICDGKVAMLLQSGFIWGERADNLYLAGFKPEMIIVIPWRISFFLSHSDKTIGAQFFSHCWVVWPERSKRAGNKTTLMEWGKR